MKNRKIELRLKPFTDTSWCLQWRIEPQELGWFRRKFNFWKTIMFHSKNYKSPFLFLCRTETERSFSLSRFFKIKEKLKDEQDLRKFKEDQKEA